MSVLCAAVAGIWRQSAGEYYRPEPVVRRRGRICAEEQPPSIEYGESHFVPRQGIRSLCRARRTWRVAMGMVGVARDCAATVPLCGLSSRKTVCPFEPDDGPWKTAPVGGVRSNGVGPKVTRQLDSRFTYEQPRRRDLEFRWNRSLGAFLERVREEPRGSGFLHAPPLRAALQAGPLTSIQLHSRRRVRCVLRWCSPSRTACCDDHHCEAPGQSLLGVEASRLGHPGWPFRRLSGRCAGFRSRFRPLQECRPSRTAAGPGHLHRDLGDPLPELNNRDLQPRTEFGQNRPVAPLGKLSPQPVIREKYALRNQR